MSLRRPAIHGARARIHVRHQHNAPLRIFALPLAPNPSNPAKPLIYWHVNQHSPSSASANATVALNVRDPGSWVPYGIDKASAFWLSWGAPPASVPEGGKREWSERIKGMKYWVWKNGERLMDKIECEEWGLKSVNPSIPAFQDGSRKIPLLYPASHPCLKGTDLTALLRQHLSTKIPYHKSLLVRSLILLPFTLPVAALPIIPNLPGFYVAFRAYSHWKALQGARFLEKAMEEGEVVVQADEVLAGCFIVPDASSDSGKVEAIHGSIEDAPDATSTPPTTTKRGITLPGTTTIEKATAITNLTHGTDSSTPHTSQSDGIAHEKTETSPDTTATPESLVHPSQRKVSSPEETTARNTSATVLTTATPLFTSDPSTSSTSSSASSSADNKADAKLFFPLANVPRLVRAFELSPSEVVDVTRAAMQARLRWKRVLKDGERKRA